MKKTPDDAARAIEDRLHLLQNITGTMFWQWDIATGKITGDEQAFAMLGLDPDRDRASHETWYSLLHPDDRDSAGSEIARTLREHTFLDSDYRIIRSGNQVRWINVKGRGLYDEHGHPIRMEGIWTDITEQRKAWQDRYSVPLVEKENPDPVLRIGKEGGIIYANEAGRQLLSDHCTPGTGLFPPHITERIRESFEGGFNQRTEVMFGEKYFTLSIIPIPGRNCANLYFTEITHLKQHESFLEENDLRFRLALSNAPVSLAIQDRDLIFRWAFNQRTIRPEDVIGKTDTEIFTPDDAALLIGLKRRVIETGNDHHTQVWLTMNGQRLFLDLYLKALTDENGEISGIAITTINLTDIKIIESDLRESKGRLYEALGLLDAVTKGADVIIAAQNTSFEYTYFNKAYADEIARLTGRELRPGMSMDEVFDRMPGELRKAREEWSRVLSGESVNARIDFGVPGRNRRSYHVIHIPIRDSDGIVIGAGEVAYNITELARIEDELGETRKYLESLITYANAPIIVWDPDFRITRFNHAFEHMTGIPAEEAIGQTLDILFPQDSVDDAMALIRKTMTGERWEIVEIPILHRNGDIRTVLWNSASIYGPDMKTIISIIAQGQDITEQIAYERDLIMKARDLGEINRELADEIMHRKTIDAQLENTLSMLNAAFESTADGIIVIDISGKIISYNKNFINMWTGMEGLAVGSDSTKVIGSIAMQLRDPGDFLTSTAALVTHPERESFDMVELRDGRIFERYTKSQKIGDTVVGRLWSYRDITNRRRAEEQLIASLAEKEVLLREVHHRVKNNLQLISGLLDMTRLRTTDHSALEILTDVMLKIQTMAKIHTRLYESKQFGRMCLEDQIQDQVISLSAIYSSPDHDITTEIHPSGVYLPVDQAIPCALVVNEILSNAFKHAFKGRGRGSVSITTGIHDGEVVISIRDDGVGLPEEFDIYKTSTLGIKLVRTLVEHQLRGTLKFMSDNGTEVRVKFPLVLPGR